MLLWTSLLCLFSANLVASKFSSPEIFAGYDPRTVLQPLNNGLEKMDSSDNVRVIRALLAVRQSGCPAGYAECTNRPGKLVLQFSLFSVPRRDPHAFSGWSFVCCFAKRI